MCVFLKFYAVCLLLSQWEGLGKMEKIVRTVYRQLYKKATRVDKDVAMRSVLTCSPKRVYDHRRREWVAFDVAKQAGWPESRIFLDNLIRKLNCGREFYIPTLEGNRNDCDKNVNKNGSGGGSSSSGSSHRNGTDESERSSSLLQVLRQSFEETPFAITQMNNAFAALKELAYVTDMASKHYKFGVPPPEIAKTLPAPKLTVVDGVEEMHHLSLTRGLSDVLEKIAGEGEGGMSRTSEEDVRVKEERGPPGSAKAEDEEGEDDSEDGDAADLPCGGKSKKTPFDTPDKVQLLLAHPQLYDFFRYTVMVVVRDTPNESAAFVLNKPLENDEGMVMPVNATIRLNHVHPILGKHLGNHTVMIGGPVSRGSFDSSILLLHRVPGIEDAIPLSQSLWVDGNYDALQRRLEDGTADPADIVVICGFSGWGGQQLAGEIQSGTWVVARGRSDDPAMDDFLFALTRCAGAPATAAAQQTSTPPPGATATTAMPPRGACHRGAAAWAWAYSTLGAPYVDLARNQKPLMQESSER